MGLEVNGSRPFGAPLPGRPHAVSVSLPRWADVVAYEEGEQETLHAMSCGYPRFFLHPLYHQLRRTFAAAARPGEAVWVFPSAQVAWACVAHVGAGRVATAGGGVALVLVPDALQAKVKEFWQHTGMIVSSRLADAILANRPAGSADALTRLRGLVAEYNGVGADDIHLAPSGMGAIHQAHLAVTAVRAGHPVQLGFPYIDTLKLLQKFGGGAYFPYNSADDIEPLAAAVGGGAVSAVFCEVPGNPLLRTIDLARLCAILRPQGVPLVVDDTFGTPFNIDVMPYADVVVTSLTKFFSGIGNAMGGAVTLNPRSVHYQALKRQFARQEELLCPADAEVLFHNGRGFAARMEAINANARRLAAYLREHPLVDSVFYPDGDAAYDAIRLPGGGYGGIISFTFADRRHAPLFYDRLDVAKGPSLGNDFTLACPYTLLAHYGERDWALDQGVAPELIRVSVGREAACDLIDRFDAAMGRLAVPGRI